MADGASALAAVPIPARRSSGRQRLTLTLAASVVVASTAACYTSSSLLGPPAPGTNVAATLNDRGRSALGDSVGTNVDEIEGRVVARTDTSMVLALARVRAFSGEVTRWTGEQVTLRMSSLRSLSEHRLARGPTIGLAVGVTALVVALILGRSLSGGGSGTTNETPPSPPAGT